MLHDYMMYYGDKDYIHSKMQIVRTIMNYFLELKRDDGTIKKPDYHNFVDWSFDKGEAPIDDDGYSALVDLHVLRALQWSANLEAYAGNDHFRKKYESMADQLSHTIKNTYWNYQLGLFTDIPGKNKLSQHTNCMAIITGLSKGEEAKKIMEQVLTNKQMVQATIYWHFYLFEALHKSGLGGQYIENLDTWKKMINHGCTTWPETGLQSRSECHGWGASPNLHLLKIIAGIDSDAPGFKKIKVEPFLGKAQNVKADIPHPNGNIDINISRNKKDGITGSITLPNNTTGTFLWNGKEIILKEGFNQINF